MDDEYIPDANFTLMDEEEDDDGEEIEISLDKGASHKVASHAVESQQDNHSEADAHSGKPVPQRRTSRSYSVSRADSSKKVESDVNIDRTNHFLPIRPTLNQSDYDVLADYGNPLSLIMHLTKERSQRNVQENSTCTSERLIEEIESSDPDKSTIRDLCRHHEVPEGLYCKIWKICYELDDHPSTSSWDGLLNHPHQQVITQQCESLHRHGQEFSNALLRLELEHIVTHFCKRRALGNPNGIAELLVPIVKIIKPILPTTENGQGETDEPQESPNFVTYANAFYSFASVYFPTNFIDAPESPKCMKLLFRMLCNYHDPKLCCFLEGHRIDTSDIIYPMISTLFFNHFRNEIVLYIWTQLAVMNDLSLPFLFALVILISSREKILGLGVSELNEWKASPARILEPEDTETVRELFQKAIAIGSITPKGFKHYFQLSSLQSSFEDGDLYGQLKAMACFPLTEAEVISSNQIGSDDIEESVKYFIVDCRPTDEFRAGRITSAFHLDPNFLLKDKETMEKTIQGFVSMIQDDHICFYGSGVTENDYEMNTIIFQFLSHGVHHIGLLSTGYKGLHGIYDKGKVDFEDHNPAKCKVCNERYASRKVYDQVKGNDSVQLPAVALEIKSKISTGLKDGLSSVKAKVSETNTSQIQSSVSESWAKIGKSFSSSLSKTQSTGESMFSRFKKPAPETTQTPQPNTAKANEKQAQQSTRLIPTESVTPIFKQEDIKVDLWSQENNAQIYLGSTMVAKDTTEFRYIAVTKEVIYILSAHPTRMGWATISSKHECSSLAKLSSGKTDKSIIRLEFHSPTPIVYVFQVDEHRDFIKAIQSALQKDSPPDEPETNHPASQVDEK